MFSKLVFLSAIPGIFASLQIVPGATWTAGGTNAHVQAHGGGIIEVGSVYYWVGEDHTNGGAFQAINCYSSTDLVQWTFVNEVLSLQSSGDLGPGRVVERPKILHNDATGKYVMWMHIDSSSYGEAKAGVATSDTVCGNYTYIGSSRPLGYQSRDMGLFKDTDGSGYLLTEDRANGLRIDKLSSDYLTVESNTYLWTSHYEAPALYKQGSTYFMFASHLTGWAANDNQYCTATSLSGPWSAWADFAPSGTNTYKSQTNYVLGVGDTVIYMGDRWVSTDLGSSTYVWLPLNLSGTSVSMGWENNWILDIGAGTWTPGPVENDPEAESAILANGAIILSCSACSNGKDVGYLGGSPGGTLTFSGVPSNAATTTTIRVMYTNGDATERFATVTVNGKTHILGFASTRGDNIIFASTLHTPLKSGSTNTIEFSSYNSGWAANVDRLMVPIY